MRRADRLFQIIQILRRGGLTTAAQLARELEVSVRTIYRDIRDMMASGVPIEGEAGVGYLLAEGYDLPPLMFTHLEIEALALGARMVICWADKELASAAQDILAKVNVVLPEPQKHTLDTASMFSFDSQNTDTAKGHLAVLREAIREQRKVSMAYEDAQETHSKRVVRPLCVWFCAPKWMVTTWCESRRAFRNFRLDRVQELTLLDETFKDEHGKTLNDFLTLGTA